MRVKLRLKSIGQMGNYMKTKTFSLAELAEIAKDLFQSTDTIPGELDDLVFQPNVNGYCETRSVIYKMNTPNGILLGKLTDWSVDDDGVPDTVEETEDESKSDDSDNLMVFVGIGVGLAFMVILSLFFILRGGNEDDIIIHFLLHFSFLITPDLCT